MQCLPHMTYVFLVSHFDRDCYDRYVCRLIDLFTVRKRRGKVEHFKLMSEYNKIIHHVENKAFLSTFCLKF